jgi:pyruvate formate lyase activating enzyme
MNIGGFQENSMIDFPKTIACIVFTQGCNFICPYCHNPDLVAGPQGADHNLYDEKKIFEFLEKRKGLLEGVVITGGEPTLQKDLLPFCRTLKGMGYRVKLDSNGTCPAVLARLFEEGLVDFMAMDIKTSLENYHLVVPGKFDAQRILDSTCIIMEKAPAYEFRTTCARPFITRQILKEIGRMIKGSSTYILQKCSRNVRVLDPEFLESDHLFFSHEGMNELQTTITPYVDTCLVR